MAHVVGPGDVNQRLACFSTCNRLLPLMRGQLGLATEPDATGLRALPPFASPGTDKLALEFGKAAEYSQREPAVRRCGEGGTLQVRASFTDAAGNLETAIATVPSVVDAPPALSVSISGAAREGSVLTATALVNDGDASIKYKWQALVAGAWTNISGATGSTYTVTEANGARSCA
jgi:hypothetical protein